MRELRDAFNRDDEVDAESRVSDVLLHQEMQHYDPAEEEMLEGVHKEVGGVFDTLRAVEYRSDHFVKLSMGYFLGNDTAVPSGRVSPQWGALSPRPAVVRQQHRTSRQTPFDITAEVLVDATVEECLSWEFNKCSRERMRSFYDHASDAAFLSERLVNSHHRETSEVYFDVGTGSLGFKKRTHVSDAIWKRVDGEGGSVIVVERLTNVSNLKRVSETALKPLPAISGIFAQTTIIMSLKLDVVSAEEVSEYPLFKRFPRVRTLSRILLQNSERVTKIEKDRRGRDLLISAATRHMSEIRKRFDKSNHIDRSSREEFIEILSRKKEVYTKEEKDIIKNGQGRLSAYENIQNKRAVSQIRVVVASEGISLV